jgi:apolipoprotein N-acyltransferase
MRRATPLALALLAGLAHALSIAAPWSGRPLWWLQPLALGILAWLLVHMAHERASPGRAALVGWIFATAWLCGTFWWLFISMHTYGGLNAGLAALAVLALAAFLSSYYAAACAAWLALAPSGVLGRALLFAALWMLAELMRAIWFTGFPWGGSGYAHVEGPLAGYAPWTGVYLLAGISAALAMLGAQWRAGGLRAGLAFGVLVALPMAWQASGARFSAPQGELSVTLLQGNIPQDEKFQRGTGIPLALTWYREQLLSARTQLVVAPETAIPLLPAQLPDGYIDALQARYGAGEQAALIGIPLGSFETGYSNSVIGLAPGIARPYLYDKHHLVPFGEFIPPLFRWFTDLMNIPLGDFNRGPLAQPPFEWKGQRLSPNICYEDLFGEEIGANFRDAAHAPTVLVNLSNIGWFGNSIAIDQHLLISRMRALEFERPMLRATNTGATVIIDHSGQVISALPPHQRGALQGAVEGRTGLTPFAWWVARFGVWPLWLLGLAIAGVYWLHRRREVDRHDTTS